MHSGMRVASACLGLALLVRPSAASGAEVVDRIAATVNDTAIPESEVRRAMVVSGLEPAAGETPEAFRTRILEALIEEHLEYEDAARFGPAPPDAPEIQKAMASLRERIKAEGKDPDAEFARAGMTVDEVRASIERQLVIARYLRERFAPIAYADEEQARAEYEKRYVPEQKAAGAPVAAVRRGRRGDAPALLGADVRRGGRQVAPGPAPESARLDLPDPGAGSRKPHPGRAFVRAGAGENAGSLKPSRRSDR